jgi:1-acyl-sn-glycerol-3-phosphate acyltransferase
MVEIKPQVYRDPRPADEFSVYHEWTRTHRPGWVYTAVRIILTPIAVLIYRCRAIGTDDVPMRGPFILAPNHFSNMDHFFAGVYLRRRIQFMAKSQLFGKSRVLTYIFRVGGVFPVRRGHRDEEAFRTAHAVLDRGGCVLIYAEGGRSRSGGLGKPRPGVGRLALESGVPVIPVAIHGSLGIARSRGRGFPKITVEYGEPITFGVVDRPTRDQQQQAAEQVFERVREMYDDLDERPRAQVIRSRRRRGGDAPGAGEAKLPAGEAR